MPSERKSKEDTWTPNELKKAMGKDTIRKEREERRKERLKEEQNGEEKHRRRRDEDDTRERRHHRDEDDRKHHKDKDRHHRNDDEERRRRKDRGSPGRDELTEEERERQRRERREKRDGKSTGDDDRERDREHRRKDDERERERRHKDDEREKDRRRKDDERDVERRHKDERRKHRDDDDDRRKHRDGDGDRRKHRDGDDDRRKHRDGDDDRRKHRDGDDDRRRHRDDDDERRKHRDEDGDRRRHRGKDDDDERRKHQRDEDERDKRKEKKDRDRHRDGEEDERERQRRERRDKKEGKDKDRDREKDKERDRRKKDDDVRVTSAVNGRSKAAVKKEEEEENGYDAYEDDFEDYEEDFEEDEEEVPQRASGKDDEMNQVLRALDEENDRLYGDSKRNDRYDRSDSPEDRGRGYRDDSPDDRAPRGRPKSSVINFLSAKRQVMTQQTYGKTSKRARDLLEMIELDTVTFDMMDLPPVKEYELYIRSYGRSDTRQAYVQTNDDAIDRDIQTEEIDTRSKWTQHPAEDFAGSGRGDGEKDFQEEEQSQMNKQQDLGRLSKFIQQAGQVVAILLDEERSQEKTELNANKSNISLSEGYSELSMLSILQGRHVEFAYFAPTQPNMLLTVYSKPEQDNSANPTDGKGIVCVWNTNEPSYPQRILACESQPQCCCFSPYKTSLAFAGMVDGSICAWDLREPPSLHKSVEYEQTEHLLRYPTYNTAGIFESENHISPVTTINPVITYLDENTRQESDSKEAGSGMSFQLVSSEDQGIINFWVVAEISSPDMAGSEIDLGLSPGGKIKVVISSSIKLESLVREARNLGPVRSFEMQISPTDPNHFYIGTDGGFVIHGLRFGTRTFPRTFTTLSDSPVDVKSIDFSPFGHPCFLVSTSEGCVHLFGTKSEKPLLSWPSKIWGTRNLKCVRWSRSRPCVFYVLDDHSQLYTFDILEGDAVPAKMETLSKEVVTYIAFTSHMKTTGRPPQMLVSQDDGTVQIHTISREYREQQTLENDFLPSYLEKF